MSLAKRGLSRLEISKRLDIPYHLISGILKEYSITPSVPLGFGGAKGITPAEFDEIQKALSHQS